MPGPGLSVRRGPQPVGAAPAGAGRRGASEQAG